MNKEQIVYKKTSDLMLNPKNPRKNDKAVDTVIKSIEKYGFKNPLIVDTSGVVYCGNTRLKAAIKMGLEEVPCIVADDLTEEQIREFALIDNKSNEIADWDLDLLEEELNELDMSEWDFDWGIKEDPVDIEEDEIPEAPEIPNSHIGDVYKLGDHYLMCGDSTNQEDVLKLMAGKQADLLLTDPPYNVDYEGTAGKIENDNMEDLAFREFLTQAFTNANEIMKPGASFYIWHADSEGYNFRGACHDIGWQVRQCLIWNKNSLVMGRQDYQWKHEPCLYGWKAGAAHKWYTGRSETTVLDFDKPKHNDLHPTMKPLALFSYLAQNSTKKGDIICDLFGGSGTTLIVCEQIGRKCYMMEYDPKFVDVIIQRWENLTGKKAELCGEH